MARGELIGHMLCPECGFTDAEVRPDKSGAPYRFCPECTAQYFTRGGVKASNLLKKIIPVAFEVVVVNAPPAANDDGKKPTPPVVVPVPTKPTRKSFSMDDL